MTSAVFLDRDGVINRKAPDGEYITSWSEFEFLPGALEGLRDLTRFDGRIVVVTNQRGVALGRMSEQDLMDIHRRMAEAVAEAGGRLDAVYYCPHDGGCGCRKPDVGMFQQAADELGLTLGQSTMVGDSCSDMLAAERVGARCIFIGPRNAVPADHVAADLAAAVPWILAWGRQ